MENRKLDRRSNRTQETLKRALIELILEKHYDDITVQDILDRANIGRSTFYTHFRDKEDLFRQDWEGFLCFLTQQFNFENIKKGSFVPIKALFQHLKDFHPLYRALVRSRKIDQVFKFGQNHLAKAIQNKLTILLPANKELLVPIPILSNYLANEIFNLLKWWLDQNMPYTPERMDEIFHRLITPGFRDVLVDG